MLSGELPGGQGVSKTSSENQPLQRPGLDLHGVTGPSHNPPACGGRGQRVSVGLIRKLGVGLGYRSGMSTQEPQSPS